MAATRKKYITVVVLTALISLTSAFAPPSPLRKRTIIGASPKQKNRRIHVQHPSELTVDTNNYCRLLQAASSGDNSEDDNDNDWYQSLQARQKELEANERAHRETWVRADCGSDMGVSLHSDWVRRVDVDAWPLAACGSASGTVYVTNLETNQVLAESMTNELADDADDENSAKLHPDLDRISRFMFGKFDGGGTLAIAFLGNIIVHAGREGGVQVWRWDKQNKSKQLVSQGPIPALEGQLVTTLKFHNDMLWVGTSQGSMQAFPVEDELPLALQAKPTLSWTVGSRASPVLSLDVNSDTGLVVVATTSSVYIIDCDDDDEEIVAFFQPPFDSNQRSSSNPFVRSVAIVPMVENGGNDDIKQITTDNEELVGIVCGGSEGTVFLQPFDYGNYDPDQPLPTIQPLKPQHFGPIQTIISPLPNLFVCGAQDGRISIWDIGSNNDDDKTKIDNATSGSKDNRDSGYFEQQDASCLYQFVGYKVWLGSLWSDGIRLVSDGSDNTVIVHHYNSSSSSSRNDSSKKKNDTNDQTNQSDEE